MESSSPVQLDICGILWDSGSPSPGAGAVQRLPEGTTWHWAALLPLPLLWPHSQLSAPAHLAPAAVPAPPPAQLAQQDLQFIISSLLPMFSEASSAGLYLRSSVDNLQLLITTYLSVFSLHSRSHISFLQWISSQLTLSCRALAIPRCRFCQGVSPLPGLGLHTSIATAHWEGTCGSFVLNSLGK